MLYTNGSDRSRFYSVLSVHTLTKICGDYSEEVTPVPIPNTEVKLLCADDTWWETAWESKTLPLTFILKNRGTDVLATMKLWYNIH